MTITSSSNKDKQKDDESSEEECPAKVEEEEHQDQGVNEQQEGSSQEHQQQQEDYQQNVEGSVDSRVNCQATTIVDNNKPRSVSSVDHYNSNHFDDVEELREVSKPTLHRSNTQVSLTTEGTSSKSCSCPSLDAGSYYYTSSSLSSAEYTKWVKKEILKEEQTMNMSSSSMNSSRNNARWSQSDLEGLVLRGGSASTTSTMTSSYYSSLDLYSYSSGFIEDETTSMASSSTSSADTSTRSRRTSREKRHTNRGLSSSCRY